MAPVTRLSRSFMMRLPVSKAITPLSNPTEKLEKMGSSLTDGKQHTRTHTKKQKTKSLLTHAALFDPSKTQSNKET